MSKSKSNPAGASSDVDEKEPSVMPSTDEAPRPSISDTSASSPTQATNQIGFQPTKNSVVDETTTNAQLITAFAGKLGSLVEWRRLTLADGRTVIALVFPTDHWQVDPVSSELKPVRSGVSSVRSVSNDQPAS
jgi:hypothetical protein